MEHPLQVLTPIHIVQHLAPGGTMLHKGFSSQPFTYLNATSPTYPKATDLFTKISAQFGANNVEPPPDWITNDSERVRWLKSDHNSLIYFLYRRPKYIQRMSEIVNGGCMEYKPLSKYGDAYSSCNTCCVQCMMCACACCSWADADDIWFQLNPTQRGQGACCFPACREKGIKQRQKVLKRLREMGVPNVPDESPKATAFKLLCCNMCTITQTHNVLQYYRNKRYGPELSLNGLSNWRAAILRDSPQFVRYMKDCKENLGHPYHANNNIRMIAKQVSNGTRRGKRQTKTVLVPTETVNTRENVPTNILTAYMPWGHEYTKTDQAILLHNSMWSNVAVLSNVPVQATGAQSAPAVSM